MALTACSMTPPGELSSWEVAAPTPPDGLIVGIVAVARTQSVDWTWARFPVSLKYDHQSGASGELLLGRQMKPPFPPLEVYEGVENGLAVSYRPFAMKLRPGRGVFHSFEHVRFENTSRQEVRQVPTRYLDNSGKWQSRWEWKTETVTDSNPIVSVASVPAATFDVEPGKVLYIGRVGMLLDRSCSTSSASAIHSNAAPCFVREPFIESEPTADLAMIRRYFSKLAGVEIEVRPLQTASGSWKTLSEAARPYAAGR